MKCPVCQREIEGTEFASHYQVCFTGLNAGRQSSSSRIPSKDRSSHSETQYLSAMQAEALAQGTVAGASLRGALATGSSVFLVSGDQLIYLVEEWTFTYATSGSAIVSVAVNASGARILEEAGPPPESRQSAIEEWVIDSDEACVLAEQYGGHLQTGSGPFGGGGGLFRLTAGNVDGNTVPVWLMPHRLMWRPLFIRADTGSLVYVNDREHFQFTETMPADLSQQLSRKKQAMALQQGSRPLKFGQESSSISKPVEAAPRRKRHLHHARPGPLKSMIWTLLIIAGLGILIHFFYNRNEASSPPEAGPVNASSDVPSQSRDSAPAPQPIFAGDSGDSGGPHEENPSRIRIVITPLRAPTGVIYGAEAHDKDSGVLLATAKQVDVEGDLLVVEEVQYSSTRNVIYQGKLFFSADDELVNEKGIAGKKRWQIFNRWISDSF